MTFSWNVSGRRITVNCEIEIWDRNNILFVQFRLKVCAAMKQPTTVRDKSVSFELWRHSYPPSRAALHYFLWQDPHSPLRNTTERWLLRPILWKPFTILYHNASLWLLQNAINTRCLKTLQRETMMKVAGHEIVRRKRSVVTLDVHRPGSSQFVSLP